MTTLPVRLALIRHTIPAIAGGLCYGRSDIAAAPFDGTLATTVARVASFAPTRVVSSPLRRCRVLACHLAHVTGTACTFDARLQELDFGQWEGLAWDVVARRELDLWAADPLGFAPPGGESGAALVERVSAAFADIVRGADGGTAVVSHAGPLRVLAALAAGAPVDLLRPGPAFGSVEVFDAVSPRAG